MLHELDSQNFADFARTLLGVSGHPLTENVGSTGKSEFFYVICNVFWIVVVATDTVYQVGLNHSTTTVLLDKQV